MPSSQNSRTSDLIKQFEGLSPTTPTSLTKPATLTKPTILTRRGAPAAASRAKAAIQTKHEDSTENSAIAALSAAQSALSAAIAHTQPPVTPKWQTSRQYMGATTIQTSSMPMPSRIAASLEAPHRGLPRMPSNGMQRASTFNVAPTRVDSELIAALNKRADIDEGLQMPITLWVDYAGSCIDDAQQSQARNDNETAYVKYTTARNIFATKLHSQRQDGELKGNLQYAKLRTDVESWVVDEMDKLRRALDGSEQIQYGQGRRSSVSQVRPMMRHMEPVMTVEPFPTSSSLTEKPHFESTIRAHVPVSPLPRPPNHNPNRAAWRNAIAMSPEMTYIDEELGTQSASFDQDTQSEIFDHDTPSPSIDQDTQGTIGDVEQEASAIQSRNASRLNSNKSSASDLSSMLSYHAPADGRPRGPSITVMRSQCSSSDSLELDPVLDFLQNSSSCPQSRRPPTRTPSIPQLTSSSPQQPTHSAFAAIDAPAPVAMSGLRVRPPPLPLPVLPTLPMSRSSGSTVPAFSNILGRTVPPLAPLPLVPPPPAYSQTTVPHDEPPFTPNGTRLYTHQHATGSDPALNGQMQSGSNPRNSAAYEPTDAAEINRRISQISDTGGFGVTGLKNFGNTCFMNSVIQCLVGTKPLTRYFMRGEWRTHLIHDTTDQSSSMVTEFAHVVERMWRGQYSFISPAEFRSAVARCSEQFNGNDQQDAHEFASFVLDVLHERLNHVHPRPLPERELTLDEELQFERLPDAQQSRVQWDAYTRRNKSIVSSIFQGQIQSRLTCMACQHTSTTYHMFTELSVPIPETSSEDPDGPALRPDPVPIDIYQCLDAYSESEILDGDNKWMCPVCQTKRAATKRLMIARLPLVLIVHLKRFSTVGHFREKLETNVQIPTMNLCLQKYVTFGEGEQSTSYNLYAVANHFGSMSSGHYTASVSDGLNGQWNHFDDTRSSVIHESQVATPAAYLLFFVRTQRDT
ncbi:ubiquitin-specific protease doa4 [Coemansia sp. RSA 1822]|nr:ubiquitin-specific protease doa4 [Coemansia sp. RSA 638]KAJ2541558.1 ubiquitin-specific protease doa4 [Coemansia sp. RSA 1853]KAJ2564039.1 ubiquitin-specific protease doa4 [Coemansia sp. RSA 1822]